jgi:eukaryotic-like serine/threonine-protein kinase
VNPNDSSLATALAGRYTIERELGQGGMATVYLAQDLRHHRRVAVKVLRPELAATLGHERFFKEIETAAQFQHPHILPLLDSGEAGGFLYYVMPYVEGESLRARLAHRGELPVHEAVKILIEICDALAYAHERGIVHRDIKPDNVLLSGRHALVTDFGVAKALSESTGRQQLTTAGVALGTPTYMAPEQATADPNIDHRVDLYAVGVLGYELIAGKPPLSGRNAQETLALQVTQRPDPLTAQRPSCPPALDAVIMKCLEKRPGDRWQSADELLAQLEPLATPSGGSTPTATRPVEAAARKAEHTPWRRWTVAAVLLLALGAAVAAFLLRTPQDVRLGRRVQLTLEPGLEIDPALSPDGALVSYVAGPLGQTRLYVRQVDGGTPVALTAPGGGFARMPRWSPDGRRLLFLSGRGLEVMPALGGPSKLILPAERDVWADATWSPGGDSIAIAIGDSVFVRPLEGGTARAVARLPEAHSCAWSPDGRRLACVSGNRQFVTNEEFGNHAASSIWLLPVDGGSPLRVTDEDALNMSPAWLPGSNLLYISDRDGGRDFYQLHLNRAGRPSGEASRLTTGLNANRVSVANNGRRLAYSIFTQTSNMWLLPIPTSGVTSVSRAVPITTGAQVIEWGDVSLDQRWLAFDSDRGGTPQVYRMPINGNGEVEQLTAGAEPAFAPAISPDGREIVYHTFRQGTRQVFVMPAEGGPSIQVTKGSDHSQNAEWSPDGRALTILRAYRTPAQELALVTRDARGSWSGSQTLLKFGIQGAWSPDGHSVLIATGVVGHSTGLVVVPSNPAIRKSRVVHAVRNPATDIAPAGFAGWVWSSDGRTIYFMGRDPRDGSVAIWRLPAAGGTPRLLVRFDDPTRRWQQTTGLRLRGDRFYFNLGDQQSDLWMAEIPSAP